MNSFLQVPKFVAELAAQAHNSQIFPEYKFLDEKVRQLQMRI